MLFLHQVITKTLTQQTSQHLATGLGVTEATEGFPCQIPALRVHIARRRQNTAHSICVLQEHTVTRLALHQVLNVHLVTLVTSVLEKVRG